MKKGEFEGEVGPILVVAPRASHALLQKYEYTTSVNNSVLVVLPEIRQSQKCPFGGRLVPIRPPSRRRLAMQDR
jgi:hypothetical protein